MHLLPVSDWPMYLLPAGHDEQVKAHRLAVVITTDALFILNKSVFFKVTFWNQSSGTVAGLEKTLLFCALRACRFGNKAAAWKKHSFLNA